MTTSSIVDYISIIKKPRWKRSHSTSQKFYKGIKTLMRNLQATEPTFIKCIKPNLKRSSKIWNEKYVECQLRCNGIVEVLKVFKLGYPTRIPYVTLFNTFHGFINNPLIKHMGKVAFCQALLVAFDVQEHHYTLGLTRILFKNQSANVVDSIMASGGKPLSMEQNNKISQWIVQKRIKQIIGVVKCFVNLKKVV